VTDERIGASLVVHPDSREASGEATREATDEDKPENTRGAERVV
jgi:hypothetical protein